MVHLTGESTIEEVVAWVRANPDAQEAAPGVKGATVVPAGAATYVTVEAPGVGVICSPNEPGELLIATSLIVA